VAESQWLILWWIYITVEAPEDTWRWIHSGYTSGYTMVDTQWWIHSGGYSAAGTVLDLHIKIYMHCGITLVVDTQQQINSSGYTAVYILFSSRYSS
jgi:hypothetical protein